MPYLGILGRVACRSTAYEDNGEILAQAGFTCSERLPMRYGKRAVIVLAALGGMLALPTVLRPG
jgi:hypothetical protein